MTQYDAIAEKYSKSHKDRIIRKYCSDPSFFGILENMKGKDVLDIGCGSGKLTREIKRKGAKKVIGIDISKEMIKIAKEKEKENPLGITYLVGDIAKLKKLGEFDIVTAGFLLHYSKTKKELFDMCKNIHKNLKPGGRFVAINTNPNNPTASKNIYGIEDVAEKTPLQEGGKVIINIIQEGIIPFSFKTYHWKKQTYEKALRRAGFKKIYWHKVESSKEGIKEYGKEFWRDFDKYCTLIIIEAIK